MSAPPLEIYIQGTSHVQLPSERGNLVIAETSEGTSQISVSEAVTQASDNLQALFKQLSTKPSHYSNSPNAASQEPPTRAHEASSHFEVTFQDFEKLAEVASSIFIMPNAEIRSASWSLTVETKKAAGILGRD
ncbi:hypothetical protein BELL_0110g00190 [Botrytis elliptica]|uniref:Uncharacterized protein n=1 Tax=Botrytis elliptica TaxID=278938 RepID=A0A4Z1JVC6_9HELO|nr:hypothetical protein BELL_0110g00190 [Botrytis elliptica]